MKAKPSSKGVRGPGIVGLIMAVLIVSALVPAAASASAPVNESKPVIQSLTKYPHVGTEIVIASAGKWSGSPSFTYQWEHCIYKVSCSPISGATASSYVPTSSDITYAIRLKMTGTNSEGSATAYSNETVPITARMAVCSATTPGLGAFEDSNCLKAGGTKQYAWRWPAPLVPQASGGVFHIRWQWSGVLFRVDCTNSSSGGGAIVGDNANGIVLNELQLTLTGCTVWNPGGHECKVAGGKVVLNPISGSAIELGSNPRIELKPSGGKLGSINFEGCSPEVNFLNIAYPMENASLYATMSPSNQLVLVQKTLSMQGLEAKWESGFTDLKTNGWNEVIAFRP